VRFITGIFFIALTTGIPASAGIIASSVFTANSESWTALTADSATTGLPVVQNLALTFNATGGIPGGYVSVADEDNADTFFVAPVAFSGNLSAAINGSLVYNSITDQTADYAGPLVVIKGNGVTLVYQTGTQPAGVNVWNSVSVPLGPNANWHIGTGGGSLATLSDFQTALANVSAFWITAETHNGVSETTGLDSVTLSSTDSTVPEPSTAFYLGSGLLAAAALLRRRC